MSFNDATCPKCGQKLSWRGSLTDRPPCHHCGHQVDFKALEETEKLLENKRKELLGDDDDDEND